MAETWTPLKLIQWTQGYFARAEIDSPRLTAELLLAHALGCDRVRLYLDFDKPIDPPKLAEYRALVKRRAEGEPVAYLTGEREFFGHRFKTDKRALIPRPETELIIEAALAAFPDDGRALDLCTGSGCIAIALKLAKPLAAVTAIDRSADALSLARENSAALEAPVTWLEGDLYAPLPPDARFHLITANPPYVPSGEVAALAREIRANEPAMALDGGADGLDIARRIVAGARARLEPRGFLAIEMHESHGDLLCQLCREAGFDEVTAHKDLAGLPRFVTARISA